MHLQLDSRGEKQNPWETNVNFDDVNFTATLSVLITNSATSLLWPIEMHS